MFMQETIWLAQSFAYVVSVRMMKTAMVKMTVRTVRKNCESG